MFGLNSDTLPLPANAGYSLHSILNHGRTGHHSCQGPPCVPSSWDSSNVASSILLWIIGVGHLGTPWSGSLQLKHESMRCFWGVFHSLDTFNILNISFASLHSFLIPPRWDESWSEVRVRSCLKRSPTSKWLKSLPENSNRAFCESFKNLNGILTREGRYFGQSLTATICSVATRTSLFGILTMPSVARGIPGW